MGGNVVVLLHVLNACFAVLGYFLLVAAPEPVKQSFANAVKLKEFTFLGQGEDPLDLKKCFIDINNRQAREDSAIRQGELVAERFGIGVTAEAQSIFYALSKTLPVRWDKTTIVVMNEVRITSPYLPESVLGGTPAANELVEKVLEFERKRLQTHYAGQ
ncbi:uncharacterized protein LOC113759262 [Coffea eugenioides]|uniref:uncharacterized protein LOC113759262 n=1 Tax=Coffea eugenioides TaxID=49369 RepID=UPI000F6069C1|nr:uncharacterized protein LOC113759262 [Coffea eugenioides]